MYNRRYEKVFLMLRQETAGYGMGQRAPWGRCVMELKNGQGKLYLAVQGLRPLSNGKYFVYAFTPQEVYFCGEMKPQKNGYGEMGWDFYPDNIENRGEWVEDLRTVAVVADFGGESQNVSAPLVAYVRERQNWKDVYKRSLNAYIQSAQLVAAEQIGEPEGGVVELEGALVEVPACAEPVEEAVAEDAMVAEQSAVEELVAEEVMAEAVTEAVTETVTEEIQDAQDAQSAMAEADAEVTAQEQHVRRKAQRENKPLDGHDMHAEFWEMLRDFRKDLNDLDAMEVGAPSTPGEGTMEEGLLVEETPMEGTPTGSMPMEGMPMEGMPMEGTPTGSMPMEGMPMEGTPMEGMPMEGTPMEGMPMEGTPMEGMPMEGKPMEGAPMEGMPEREVYGETTTVVENPIAAEDPFISLEDLITTLEVEAEIALKNAELNFARAQETYEMEKAQAMDLIEKAEEIRELAERERQEQITEGVVSITAEESQAQVHPLRRLSQQMLEGCPDSTPFAATDSWKKIAAGELALLENLPRQWNTSPFLLGAMDTYQHCIWQKIENGYCLGVPGKFSKKDAAAAKAMGFQDFRTVQEAAPFGYWMYRSEEKRK